MIKFLHVFHQWDNWSEAEVDHYSNNGNFIYTNLGKFRTCSICQKKQISDIV